MFLSLLFGAEIIKNTIYLYSGPGAGECSLVHTRQTLEVLLGTKYNVTAIQPDEIKTTSWERHAACFVMPGGADIPYHDNLNPDGNLRIKRYVESGGAYLGLCAGGYYGGRTVEFALETELEVNQDRDLGFFPGIVRGPTLAPYDYKTDSGARAGHIQWGERMIRLYFNGGGSFVDAEKMEGVSVLANYIMDDGTRRPAVIETSPGNGKTVLSGVHFEYDPDLIDTKNGLAEDIVPILRGDNSSRIEFLHHIFERLRLL